MKKSSKSSNRGFTLIELLVVVAIIGLLSSVVLASLNTARSKSRDAKRVTDLKQIQLALELYADQNAGQYPALTTGGSISPTYISSLPKDPSTGSDYKYSATGSGASCTGYHLAAVLENDNSTILSGKAANTGATAACSGSNANFTGVGNDCLNATPKTGTYGLCFDVVNQ